MVLLNRQQYFKLIVANLLFLFLLAWWIRILPSFSEAPLYGNYIAFQDWTRIQLIETGHLGELDALTVKSKWAGSGNYKFNNYTTAILNILAGKTGIQSSIGYLRLIPIGLIVPIMGIAFYRRTAYQLNRATSLAGYVTICMFSLFPTGAFVLRTSTILGQHLIIILLAIVLLLSFGVPSKRILLSLLVLLFVAFNLHHTTAMVTLALVVGYFMIATLSSMNLEDYRSQHYLLLGIITGIVFFVVGTNMNQRFAELIGNLVQFVVISESGAGSATTFRAQSQEVFQRSLQLNWHNIKRVVRILSKTIFRGGHIILISIFLLGSYNKWRRSRQQFQLSLAPTERVLIYILPMFIIVFLVFHSYQGIAGGIIRTQNTGVIFSIPIFAVVFVRTRRHHRVIVLAMLIALASITGAVTTQQYSTASVTYTEAKGIDFVGTQVPNDRIVFSQHRLNTPLVYYDHRGIATVRLYHPHWEQEVNKIFYGHDARAADQAIHRTIKRSIVSQQSYSDRRNNYVLVSTRSSKVGVSISSFVLDPPNRTALTKFSRSRNQVYDNGVIRLYHG